MPNNELWEAILREYAERCHYDRREIIEALYADLLAARSRIAEIEAQKSAEYEKAPWWLNPNVPPPRVIS